MKLRSLMTAICVLAAANIVSAAPFAYVANSGTRNVTVIDTADNTITATVALPDTKPTVHPYAYGVAVGASGQKVYVGLKDTNEIYVFDAYTKNQIKRIGLGTDSPGGLAVNAAETRLYVTSNQSNTLIVIDITGSGAVEVGRVSVDDASISSPDGVVLNAAGNRAYVASTTTGNIAEISLDEATNSYGRLSVTPLGAGVQPVGLALSPDGSKLYASSLSGAVKMIKTSDKAITDLPVGTGTVTVAATPDSSKVYAPSNSLDKLYVIDAAANPNTVLGNYPIIVGAPPASAAGPLGSSVTPDGTKLYLTMNTGTGGNTVNVLNTANLSAQAVSITLPTGAKPVSMGNFIGPALPSTINATKSGNCIISPEGSIPVNAIGRAFTLIDNPGPCELTVDGVSQGLGKTSYAFTNVVVDPPSTHTIAFEQVQAYALTADWTGAGYLYSTPAGINASTKNIPVLFAGGPGKTVTIYPSSGYSATNWSGACAGTADNQPCVFTDLNAPKTFAATLVGGGGPVKNITRGTYHQTIDDAIANAATNDEIRVADNYSPAVRSVTTAGLAAIAKVSCGWDANFQTQTIPASSAYALGTVTIVGPGLIVDNMII